MQTIRLYLLLVWRTWIKIVTALTQAWIDAWGFLKAFLSGFVYVIFQSRLLVLVTIALLFLLYQNQTQILGKVSLLSCSSQNNIRVIIGYPQYIAANEIAEIQILVQNTSAQSIKNLHIKIVSDHLWFPDGNSLAIDKLEALGINQGKIRVSLPSFVLTSFVPSPEPITLRVFVQQGDIPPEMCDQPMLLRVGNWRRWFTSTTNLMYYVDVTLRLLGLATALISAFLTLSGKWTELLGKIREWIQR